ncbi:hypothetical protein DEO72_LG4g1409 [Vigna unguiculata]|uniref:Uncharacterized protein n=1 Tax=Vigna unguiculata TaxID=3917 RepID=A0A4D6LPN9_VIGUN|nr:hypothetical protein DEO72_LG4g1409 [Vigna unguiculata]
MPTTSPIMPLFTGVVTGVNTARTLLFLSRVRTQEHTSALVASLLRRAPPTTTFAFIECPMTAAKTLFY